ncbi:MAG: potassium transporter Kup [Alphaproteobacteria bacterium]|nr:potassium transporter Kup [Alphaproteobacteria bacterium]
MSENSYSRRFDKIARPDKRTMILAALGVVYGDIGTSPLYTMREVFTIGDMPIDDVGVLGILSLVFWALVLTVTIKYITLVLRANNNGEGGALALGVLAGKFIRPDSRRRKAFLLLAIAGMSLFFGDCLITPAISVLSAVEGLGVISPVFDHAVVPIVLAILVALFSFQRMGTHSVGSWFGPVMGLWFIVLGLLGISQIVQQPQVLFAINPYYALRLLVLDPWHLFLAMGLVVLAVTGVEALYADMGHLGRDPIRHAWLMLVLPGLVLNYFGQGALLLRQPEAAHELFFAMAPDWGLYPLVALATAATVIASQAVISGVFSLTRQAILLGFLPRMQILHTSPTEQGQIYIPRINWLIMSGVILLVLGFGSSSELAAAYGVAATGTIMITSFLVASVAMLNWKWSLRKTVLVFGGLSLFDFTFFTATLMKIPEGGWFPLVVGGTVFTLVAVWRHGRRVLYNKLYRDAMPMQEFLQNLSGYHRTPGTAVYMTADVERMPKALFYNLKHNKALHERVIAMTLKIEDIPWWPVKERVAVTDLGHGCYSVVAHYGFLDRPDVPKALRMCAEHGLQVDPENISYFLSRETLLASRMPDLGPIEERLYIALSASAQNATDYYRIPPKCVLELGTQVEI